MGLNLDHFGFLAPFYERFIKPKTPVRLIALLDFPPEATILDAGGGTGRVSQFLRGQDNTIVVLDSSCKMLIEAKKKDDLTPVCATTEGIPFADNTFDRIIIVDALHHVEHQSQTISELIKVLKLGGTLIIEEPDINKFGVKLIALAEKLFLMRSHFLSAREITRLCESPTVKIHSVFEKGTTWVVIDKIEKSV